jgi:sRNA-binding protein
VRKPGTWGEIEDQILAARKKLKEEQEKTHVPAQRTERQQQTLDAEIAAGRRRLAHFEAQEKARQQIPPDPNDPKPTPVFRPKDHVPDINSKDPALASQDLK